MGSPGEGVDSIPPKFSFCEALQASIKALDGPKPLHTRSHGTPLTTIELQYNNRVNYDDHITMGRK